MSANKDDLTRAKRKLTAIRRAERRLINRLADIDWEFDELHPEIEALEDSAGQGELPEFVIEHED